MPRQTLSLAYPILLVALLASPAAGAASFYAGVAAGGEYDERYDALPTSADVDNSARVHLGWQFARDWSVEAAYHDLGRTEAAPIADFGLDTETDGWSLGVRYLAPVEWPVKPYASLGYFSFEEDGRSLGIAGPRRFSSDEDGLAAEVGAVFELNDSFALRAGYQWFDFDAGSEGAFNAGGEIRF